MSYSIQTTCNAIQGIYTLEWIKALNRKELPKKVFVCSEHFIDGKPTDRNPYPKLKLGYEIKATPGRRKTLRQDSAVKKRKLNNDRSDSDMGISEFDYSRK